MTRKCKPSSRAKDEIHRTHHAQTSPQIVQFQWLIQEKHGERHEDCQSDHFLHDFELPDLQACFMKTNAVGWYLQQILHQRNAPAHQRSGVLGQIGQALEMTVPRKCHEHIGSDQQQNSLQSKGNG
jgi:hypothetical protein